MIIECNKDMINMNNVNTIKSSPGMIKFEFTNGITFTIRCNNVDWVLNEIKQGIVHEMPLIDVTDL